MRRIHEIDGEAHAVSVVQVMAWHFARYIGKVAEAGKAQYNLPVFTVGRCQTVPRP